MKAVRKIAGPNGNREEEEEELKSVREGKGCYTLEGKARFADRNGYMLEGKVVFPHSHSYRWLPVCLIYGKLEMNPASYP